MYSQEIIDHQYKYYAECPDCKYNKSTTIVVYLFVLIALNITIILEEFAQNKT